MHETQEPENRSAFGRFIAHGKSSGQEYFNIALSPNPEERPIIAALAGKAIFLRHLLRKVVNLWEEHGAEEAPPDFQERTGRVAKAINRAFWQLEEGVTDHFLVELTGTGEAMILRLPEQPPHLLVLPLDTESLVRVALEHSEGSDEEPAAID